MQNDPKVICLMVDTRNPSRRAQSSFIDRKIIPWLVIERYNQQSPVRSGRVVSSVGLPVLALIPRPASIQVQSSGTGNACAMQNPILAAHEPSGFVFPRRFEYRATNSAPLYRAGVVSFLEQSAGLPIVRVCQFLPE